MEDHELEISEGLRDLVISYGGVLTVGILFEMRG